MVLTSVHEDIAAEYQGGKAAVDELASRAVREEGGHEAEENEAPQPAEEVGHPRGEVVLGLAGKGREENKNPSGQKDGVENDGGLIEGDDDGDGVRLEEGEAGQEEQVGRVRVALPVG